MQDQGKEGHPTLQLFHASDGGTFALDWLMSSDVLGSSASKNNVILKKETTPIVVVVPGLTSDSTAVYIKHLAYSTAKQGWNVVVCNHRGMGGVPFTLLGEINMALRAEGDNVGVTPSSARLFDAIFSGCIPVIISDVLELPFEGILDYRKMVIFNSSGDMKVETASAW